MNLRQNLKQGLFIIEWFVHNKMTIREIILMPSYEWMKMFKTNKWKIIITNAFFFVQYMKGFGWRFENIYIFHNFMLIFYFKCLHKPFM